MTLLQRIHYKMESSRTLSTVISEDYHINAEKLIAIMIEHIEIASRDAKNQLQMMENLLKRRNGYPKESYMNHFIHMVMLFRVMS